MILKRFITTNVRENNSVTFYPKYFQEVLYDGIPKIRLRREQSSCVYKYCQSKTTVKYRKTTAYQHSLSSSNLVKTRLNIVIQMGIYYI